MTILIGGIFLLVNGILTYFFPNIVAGYNTMTKEQKEKVNINGFRWFMSISISLIGIILLVLYFLGYSNIGFFIFIVVFGFIPIVVIAQKYI